MVDPAARDTAEGGRCEEACPVFATKMLCTMPKYPLLLGSIHIRPSARLYFGADFELDRAPAASGFDVPHLFLSKAENLLGVVLGSLGTSCVVIWRPSSNVDVATSFYIMNDHIASLLQEPSPTY